MIRIQTLAIEDLGRVVFTPGLMLGHVPIRSRHLVRSASVSPAAMTEQHFWIQGKPGNISHLRLRKGRIPKPAIGEARIAIKAVGLNFADVFTTLGLYAAAPKSDVLPGLEFSGVVEEIGPAEDIRNGSDGVCRHAFSVGDRVMGVTRFGAFTSHLNAKVPLLQPIPEGWSFREGAAFLVQGLTAMYGLRDQGNLKKRKGESSKAQAVLVHSAAGGCGQFAMAICHAYGAKPIATVSSQNKVSYLRTRFPWIQEDQIIVRDASGFASQVQAALKAQGSLGFDIILDAVSGEYFKPGFEALAPGGRYVVYGAANWTPTGDRPGWLRLAYQYIRRPRLDPLQMIGQNRSLADRVSPLQLLALMGFNLIYLFDQAESLKELAVELLDLQLPPPNIAATFDFEDAPTAIRYLQSGVATGKVVLELEGG